MVESVCNVYVFILTNSHSISQNWFGRLNDSQLFTTNEQFGRPKLVRYAQWVFGCALCKSRFRYTENDLVC